MDPKEIADAFVSLSPLRGRAFVSVRRVERAYGGPEEGGWYYDAETVHEGITEVATPPAYHQAVLRLVDAYDLRWSPKSEGTPGRYEGPTSWRLVVSSTRPVRREVQGRPQYE